MLPGEHIVHLLLQLYTFCCFNFLWFLFDRSNVRCWSVIDINLRVLGKAAKVMVKVGTPLQKSHLFGPLLTSEKSIQPQKVRIFIFINIKSANLHTIYPSQNMPTSVSNKKLSTQLLSWIKLDTLNIYIEQS